MRASNRKLQGDKDIKKLRVLEESLATREREMLALFRLSEIFHSSRPLAKLYYDIVGEIGSATGFPISSIAIFDHTQKKMIFHGPKGLPDPSGRAVLEVPLEESYLAAVLRTGKPIIVTKTSGKMKYRRELLEKVGARTFIAFPMTVGGRIVGALGLGHVESLELGDQLMQWIQSLTNFVGALTERKRLEEDLRTSHEQLRELSTHLQIAIEEERKTIAREIHDELGQDLSLLRLELGLIEGRLRDDQEDLRREAKSMSKVIVEAIDTVRRISSSLRPTMLDNLGLGAAVEWHVKEFARRTKIRCDLSIEPAELKADPDRSTAIFRILQEALTNVARHSKATKVKVKLQASEESIELTVDDNGIGIVPQQIADARSFGLIGIRERVHQLAGNVSISKAPGQGTRVSITVPRKL